jgi:hypothetical protein
MSTSRVGRRREAFQVILAQFHLGETAGGNAATERREQAGVFIVGLNPHSGTQRSVDWRLDLKPNRFSVAVRSIATREIGFLLSELSELRDLAGLLRWWPNLSVGAKDSRFSGCGGALRGGACLRGMLG